MIKIFDSQSIKSCKEQPLDMPKIFPEDFSSVMLGYHCEGSSDHIGVCRLDSECYNCKKITTKIATHVTAAYYFEGYTNIYLTIMRCNICNIETLMKFSFYDDDRDWCCAYEGLILFDSFWIKSMSIVNTAEILARSIEKQFTKNLE